MELKDPTIIIFLQGKFQCRSYSFVLNYGGFVSLRHIEMRYLTAALLSTVCKDICNEHCLQKSENGI